MKKAVCKFLLHLIGWTADGTPPSEDKCVILGVPHTCIADFFVAYLYYGSLGHKAHIMIKKEFFKGLHGRLMVRMGCIPTDRSNGAAVVRSVLSAMNSAKGEFHLCIAPEGTRKAVKHWKCGYHTIAKAMGCKVYPGYFDWSTKHIGIKEEFPLTDDAKADTARLQAYYDSLHLGAKHQDWYFTI